jgi:SpoU rRNA methylase family enzyme
MSNWKRVACLTLLGAGVMLADQWTGWITDAKCAKDPSGNFVGEMHKKCVEQGQPIVFVNEADKSIHVISNAAAMNDVKDAVGQKVTIDGMAAKDGSIEVKTVVQASPTR